jgi:hypothetical protein
LIRQAIELRLLQIRSLAMILAHSSLAIGLFLSSPLCILP